MRKGLIKTDGQYHGFATLVQMPSGGQVIMFAQSNDDLHDAFLRIIRGAPRANAHFDVEKIRAVTLSERELPEHEQGGAA